ncbi:MAG: hypothetical protein OEL50_02570 [Rhodospirillaceae bacterium]|nr:hypothetical protein [Rhodospirillaceae bacterium]
MNVSNAKQRARAGALFPLFSVMIFALGAGITTSAFAQSAPVELTPPTAADGNETPQPLNEAPNTQETQSITPTEVKIENLSGINLDTIGVLTPEEGGFSRDLWYGMDRQELESLLVKLSVTTSSPATRDIMRRLLLTGADVPEGENGKLVTIRAKLLADMGDFVGVAKLMDSLPGMVTHKELLRIEVDTRLLTGDNARACELAQLYMADESSSYWQKVFIFCQALSGQHDAAALGVSLLNEMGARDNVFYTLIDHLAVGGKVPTIDSLSDPKPLHLALARAAKARFPSDTIESNLPGVLRAIAISPNASTELRLEAAERAEVAGALPVDALRQIYASIQFNESELSSPLANVTRRSGPMSRALLYRASLMQTAPSAQAITLSRALAMARSGGRYASTARAFLPVLSRVEPSKELAWFAPEAIRAFLITGRHTEAATWFATLKQSSKDSKKLTDELISLMPIARLSGFAGAMDWDLKNLTLWQETTARSTEDKDVARNRAAILGAVFDALGNVVPNEFWIPLVNGPERLGVLAPHPALWFRLSAAAERAHVGETILLSLVIMGNGGPDSVETVVLHRLLTALRTVGLEKEAREIALEAAVSAGL